jgi:hypothetical protein
LCGGWHFTAFPESGGLCMGFSVGVGTPGVVGSIGPFPGNAVRTFNILTGFGWQATAVGATPNPGVIGIGVQVSGNFQGQTTSGPVAGSPGVSLMVGHNLCLQR